MVVETAWWLDPSKRNQKEAVALVPNKVVDTNVGAPNKQSAVEKMSLPTRWLKQLGVLQGSLNFLKSKVEVYCYFQDKWHSPDPKLLRDPLVSAPNSPLLIQMAGSRLLRRGHGLGEDHLAKPAR